MGALEPVLGSLAPRLHMLLLWLSLLLSMGTCYQIYGKTTGSYFETPDFRDKEITEIEFFSSIVGLILGFRVRFGSTRTDVFCKGGPIIQKVTLFPNEHVIRIKGTYGLYIRKLVFTTNRGREIAIGYRSGNEFIDGEGRDNRKVLSGLCGKCFIMGISGLCFKWDYPLDRSGQPN